MIKFDLRALDRLGRDIKEATAAFESVDVNLSFDVNDPLAIERAMSTAELRIDEIVSSYGRNQVVKNLGAQFKCAARDLILQRAAELRTEHGSAKMPGAETVENILQDISGTILDLQSADYQTISRPMKELSRLLGAYELKALIEPLVENIDLDQWLDDGAETQGGFVGSAVLEWPDNVEAEIGTTILLIRRMSTDPDFTLNFAFMFYNNGTQYTPTLRKMVGGMLVPFERKFARFVRSKLNLKNAEISEGRWMNQFNFHNSTVGALQTGDNSVANVNVQASSQDHAQLLRALEQLSTELEKVSVLPNHDRDEIKAMITESCSELSKPKPNRAKLNALLPVISAAVGFTANLGGAVDFVKSAAVAAGISA